MEQTNVISVTFSLKRSADLKIKELTEAEIRQATAQVISNQRDSLEDLPDISEVVDIIHDLTNKKGKTWEIHAATVGNWPEFKTKTCYKWVKIPLDGKTKVPYPCAWRRTCKKVWNLRIVYSGNIALPSDIEKIIKECAKVGLVPALPLLLTGNVGAASVAFLEAFKACIITKGIKQVTAFSAGFVSNKTCGKWKRI